MALEAVIYQQDPFIYGCIDYNYSTELGEFGVGDKLSADNVEMSCDQSSIGYNWESPPPPIAQNTPSSPETRRKRRRSRASKNEAELESQRMTHIAVERNRRRQMNDYLALLRSLMPPSYAQRGDQASIVGGAINFVRELEQLLQSLEAHKYMDRQQQTVNNNDVFSNLFTFPQYLRRSSTNSSNTMDVAAARVAAASIADIEVTMAETHANIKILLKRRPRQLLKMVAGFQSMYINILHLNITTVDQSVLYSFTVKVEDECELHTVNEIARAVHEMVGTIQQESTTPYSLDKAPHPLF